MFDDDGLGHKLTRYLRQEAYAIVVVCLSVCLLATLRKSFRTDLHEIFREGWQWANEQMVKFWWQSASRIWIQIRIRIATLDVPWRRYALYDLDSHLIHGSLCQLDSTTQTAPRSVQPFL